MIVALAVAALVLGVRRGRPFPAVMDTCTRAIGDVASILLMIGGSGAFKEVLVQTDGEVAGRLPLECRVVPHALRVVVP